MPHFFSVMTEYQRDIVGKWQTHKRTHIYEFKPLFNLSVTADLIIDTIETGETQVCSYGLTTTLDGEAILEKEFGSQKQRFKIHFLSDTMLILHGMQKDEFELILVPALDV